MEGSGRMKLGDSEMIFKDCRFQAPFLHVETYVSIFQSPYFIQTNLLQYVLNDAFYVGKIREGSTGYQADHPSNPQQPVQQPSAKPRGRALQHGGFHKELTGDGAESRPMGRQFSLEAKWKLI